MQQIARILFGVLEACYTFVLKGGQNIGKSSVVRNLASPDWVCDTSQDNDKDFLQAIHSGWIYELAELDSIVSKKEAGKLKNLISSPKDNFRPPYGRRMEAHKRRSIFIGTSNRDDFCGMKPGLVDGGLLSCLKSPTKARGLTMTAFGRTVTRSSKPCCHCVPQGVTAVNG